MLYLSSLPAAVGIKVSFREFVMFCLTTLSAAFGIRVCFKFVDLTVL